MDAQHKDTHLASLIRYCIKNIHIGIHNNTFRFLRSRFGSVAIVIQPITVPSQSCCDRTSVILQSRYNRVKTMPWTYFDYTVWQNVAFFKKAS